MLPIKIDAPSWRNSNCNIEHNKTNLRCVADLVDETRDVDHFQ